jgi:hypothetical protein
MLTTIFSSRKNKPGNSKRKEDEMSYGPSLPATGGGVASASLIWGVYSQTWLVVVFSIIGLITCLYGLYNLRKGEKTLKS